MLYFWEIIVDIAVVVGVLALAYAGYRVGRKLYRRHKEKKLMKKAAQQRVLDQENVQDKVAAKEKVSSKFKFKNNVFSTIENYLPKKIKAKKYSKLRSGLLEGNVEPDYVKTMKDESGKTYYDKRTYIQCYDEELASEFAKVVGEYTEDDLSAPNITEIRFNKDSGLAPLIVSATNKFVYNKGTDMLDAKAEALAEEYKNVFPISFVYKTGKTTSQEVCNSLEELAARNSANPEPLPEK